jgi:hypothetical protein
MSTYSINGIVDYSSLPIVADTDTIDIQNEGKFTCSSSTVPLLIMWCNTRFRTFEVTNNSPSTPIFIRFSAASNSSINGGGNLNFNGEFIDLFTADGTTPNIAHTLPLDSAGDKYARASHLIIDGKIWVRAPNLTNMYGTGDPRGMHYTYDESTGAVTFGDGINGAIPNGLVQIYNIELQGNGVQINHGNTITTVNKALWCDVDLRIGGSYHATDFAIYNNTQEFRASDVDDSFLVNFGYSGDASNNTRIRTPRGVHDNIRKTTYNTNSTEVFQDAGKKTIGEIRCDIVAQKSGIYPRVRFDNDDSAIQVLRVYSGGSGIYASYDGVNGGTIEELRWSTGYLRTDTIPFSIVQHAGSGQNQYINNVIRDGNESWSGEMEFPIYGREGELHVANMELPSDASVDELIHIESAASGSASNILFLGTSNSGTRDINVYAEATYTCNNVKVPNDTSFGNQASSDCAYNFVSIINQTFSPNGGLRSATIYKNATYDEGELVFQPYYKATDSATTLLSGVAESVINITSSFYLADTITKVQVTSNALAGVEAINSITLNGANTSNFDIEFRLANVGDSFTGSFVELTLSNFQTSFDTLALLNSNESWKVQYNVIRTAGTVSNSYLRGIFIGCDIDPLYVWEPIGAEIEFTMFNILHGSQFVIWNTTQSRYVDIGFAGIDGIYSNLLEGIDFNDGDSGQIWVAYQNGLTVMNKVKVDFTFGTNNISIPTTQDQLEEFSSANGFIDGSTVTWLGLDPNDPHILQFDASTSNLPQDSNGNATAAKWELASWYYYAIAHIPDGILLFFDEMDIIDGSNVRLNNGVKLDNIGNRQIYFTDRDKNLFTSDGSSWTLGQMTGNYGVVSENAIPSTIVVTSPLSSSQEANIALISEIDSLIEQRLDVAISTRASQSSLSNIPTSPLLSNDSRLDNLDAPVSGVSISEQDKNDIATKVWDEEL